MNYLRGALSSVSQYYRDINPSTLTGAIDVIVVRRTNDGGDEELVCSPFHVRFGKWQVLRPSDKKVKVLVNGQEIPFNMKIGDAGEAYFVFETDDDVPEDLIASPIIEATDPGEDNPDVLSGRFGSKEDEDDERGAPSSSRKSLNEPEPLDLNNSYTEASKTPRPSGLSLTKPPSRPHSPSPESPTHDADSFSPSTLLGRTARLGKAVVQAAAETEREKQEQLRDQFDAASNMATHAYQSAGRVRLTDGFGKGQHDDKGDEALPHIKEGEGEPPKVVYTHDMVFDMAGYHSKNDSSEINMEESEPGLTRRSSRPLDNEELEIQSASDEGPSTPRSGNPSLRVTPDRTPETSRSPSPDNHYGSVSPKRLKPHQLTTLRASSQPPESSGDGSPPAYSWEWGAFPTPSPMKASFAPARPEPLEVHRSLSVPPDLDHEPEIYSDRPSTPTRSSHPYPSPPSTPTTPTSLGSHFYGEGGELTADERNGRRFLITLGGRTYEFALSICEGLSEGADEVQDAKVFRDGQVSFRRFMKFPAVVHDKNLVIRWNDRYITRQDGSSLMACLVGWRDAALAKPANASALEEEEPLSSSDEREPDTEKPTPKKSSSSWVRWWRTSRSESQEAPTSGSSPWRSSTDQRRPSLVPSNSAPPETEGRVSTPVPFPQAIESTQDSMDHDSPREGKRFAKTLRLTSEQLKQLDLKAGPNSITFSLSSTGTIACTARLFLWESTDSVVVSDIDGTITKSDALGHVFTMIGRDWTHIGVAKLYTDITRNGYRVMYLTSRAIGQADSTRDYLKGIKQNNYQLPEGPVIMSPDRLMASLHREVIMRKPEVFKMACLRDIQRLFGEGKNPFYAGFGNRITDALSYRSVNIPSQRIFTIDSTGEVKMELLEVAGYKSSYIHLNDLVDQMFPPIHQMSAPEFTDFNYWKTPVQDYPLPDFSPPSPALSARSETSNQSTFSRLRNFSLGRQGGKQFTLPPPATQGNSNGRGSSMRHMTSLERLTRGLSRSADALEESSSSTLVDSEDDRERRARKRLSTDSMPGSLPGSLGSRPEVDFDEEEEEEDMDEDEDEDDDGYGGEMEDPEEAAEEGFDEDFLATGEMESIPFL